MVDAGGLVPVKAGTQQLPVHHSHTAVRGRSFTAAASLRGVQTHDGFGCRTVKR